MRVHGNSGSSEIHLSVSRLLDTWRKQLKKPFDVLTFSKDIPLIIYNGRVASELSLFNRDKSLQNVSVDRIYGQKVVSVKFNERLSKEFPDCTELLDELGRLNSTEALDWIELLKTHALTYTKVMQRQSRKKMKSDQRKKFFLQVTEETGRCKQELLRTFPCLYVKFRVRNHQNQLKEIIFTENFLEGMGYSAEEFVSIVRQEGLPQLMPYENPLATHIMKVLLNNYFTLKSNGMQVAELEAPLFMKNNNFARNMEFKSHFLMNYEMNTFGIDMIFTVTGFGEPYIAPRYFSKLPLNEEFIQMMIQRETEAEYFSTVYYNKLVGKNYSHIYEMCLVKELGMDIDDFTVKKYEEES